MPPTSAKTKSTREDQRRLSQIRSSHLRLLLGNGEARLSINGKQRTVPPVANGVGYDITPTRVKTLPRASWPKCSGA